MLEKPENSYCLAMITCIGILWVAEIFGTRTALVLAVLFLAFSLPPLFKKK